MSSKKNTKDNDSDKKETNDKKDYLIDDLPYKNYCSVNYRTYMYNLNRMNLS